MYYYKPETGSLWQVPVSGGDEQQLRDVVLWDSHFVPSDRGIYFVPPPDPEGRYTVRFYNSASGEIHQLTTLPARPGYALSTSPDGRYLLCTMQEQPGADLMLVESFQ